MQLEWAMLANHVEVVNNAAYVHGGGIDTVQVQQLPAAFVGGILIRFSLHPTEIQRPHDIEIRFATEDGQTIAQIKGILQVGPNPDLPTGWLYHAMMAFNFGGLPLPREGLYSVDILAAGNHLKSLPLRVKVLAAPQQPHSP